MEHLSDTDLERYYLGMIPDASRSGGSHLYRQLPFTAPGASRGLALGSINDRQRQLSEEFRAFSDRGLRPPRH